MTPIPIKYTYDMITNPQLVKISSILETLSEVIGKINDRLFDSMSILKELETNIDNFQVDSKLDQVSQLKVFASTLMTKQLKTNGIGDSIDEFLTRYDELNSNLLVMESMSKSVDITIRDKLKEKGCANPDTVLLPYQLDTSGGGSVIPEEPKIDPTPPEPTPQDYGNLCVYLNPYITAIGKTHGRYTTYSPQQHNVMMMYVGLNKFLNVPKENIFFRDEINGVDSIVSSSKCQVRWEVSNAIPKCQPNEVSGKFDSPQDRMLFYAYSYNYGSGILKDDSQTLGSMVAQINEFKQAMVIFETNKKESQYWPICEQTKGITKPCLVLYSCDGFNKDKLGINGELNNSLNGKFFLDVNDLLHPNSGYQLRNLTYAKFYEELLKKNSSVKKINFNNFDENQVILTCPTT